MPAITETILFWVPAIALCGVLWACLCELNKMGVGAPWWARVWATANSVFCLYGLLFWADLVAPAALGLLALVVRRFFYDVDTARSRRQTHV